MMVLISMRMEVSHAVTMRSHDTLIDILETAHRMTRCEYAVMIGNEWEQ